jgi:hypothetical protein
MASQEEDPFIALEKMLARKGKTLSSPGGKMTRITTNVSDDEEELAEGVSGQEETAEEECASPAQNNLLPAIEEGEVAGVEVGSKRKGSAVARGTIISFGSIKDAEAAKKLVEGSSVGNKNPGRGKVDPKATLPAGEKVITPKAKKVRG